MEFRDLTPSERLLWTIFLGETRLEEIPEHWLTPAEEEAFEEVLQDWYKHTSYKRGLPVLCLRFGFESSRRQTREEIAKHYGITRERIRQIEIRALRQLRNPIISNKLKPYAPPRFLDRN